MLRIFFTLCCSNFISLLWFLNFFAAASATAWTSLGVLYHCFIFSQRAWIFRAGSKPGSLPFYGTDIFHSFLLLVPLSGRSWSCYLFWDIVPAAGFVGFCGRYLDYFLWYFSDLFAWVSGFIWTLLWVFPDYIFSSECFSLLSCWDCLPPASDAHSSMIDCSKYMLLFFFPLMLVFLYFVKGE